jgi:hypothetical protein
MFGIPFLLQYLLDTYGLRATTLLGSCLWLSVGLAGALFGKGVTSIEEENIETLSDESAVVMTENEIEHPIVTRRRSDVSSVGLIYGRRTSLLPISHHHHHHQQHHERVSSLHQQHHNSEKLMVTMPTIYEGFTSNPRDRSTRFVEITNRNEKLSRFNFLKYSLILSPC